MFSIPSFYELGSCSDTYDVVGMLSSPNPNLSPRSMAEAKAVAAGISHKEAERRRRKRINGHIATLKSILPNTIKTDKASLLGEAVRLVKELKKTVTEQDEGGGDYPSEGDELKVSQCEATGLIKAALSCDDRPEIILDMIEALKAAEAQVVRAEMATVGGRTKSVLWIRLGAQNDAGLGGLRRALKMVMDKSEGSGQGSKRARYYHL
ncbi:transcription factor bHLH30-like [Salvia divinorum]|uniref:Transcription factor bHLH30-like n=1 Tax=Salvia divinorum TaxID=28513 RepID=A0ABD1ILV6_SALDI